MDLTINISQKQTLIQHTIQSMEILQMSAQELEAYVEKLFMENPVVELPENPGMSAYERQRELQRKQAWLEASDFQNKSYYRQDHSTDDLQNSWYNKGNDAESLSEHLFSQLVTANYSNLERQIIKYIIFSLDSRGYFTEDINAVAEFFAVPPEIVGRLLKDVQMLEPTGVGARDLKECLLLQLKRQGLCSPAAEVIIKHHLEHIAKNHLHHIEKLSNIPMEEILRICSDIRKLNPKPGNAFADHNTCHYIRPDAIVEKQGGHFKVLVNDSWGSHFMISPFYQDLLKNTDDCTTRKYLQNKIKQAEWIQSCISQRTSTISCVMQILVDKQSEFFEFGPGHKRPMHLYDFTSSIAVHESTISRTLNGKYLQCAWGVFPLNYFLTSAATKNYIRKKDEKSPEQIQTYIQKIVASENKARPLSDQAISHTLEQYGIKIARRTINKYRTELGIPDKSGRKLWI